MAETAPQPLGAFRAGLGEGPLWDAGAGRLRWLDLRLARLHETDPGTGETTWRALPDRPGALALAEGGGLLLAMGRALWRLGTGAGAPRQVAALGPGPAGRFNDGKPDALGRFWVGTADPSGGTGGALCRYAPGERLVPVLAGVSMSNGLGWSPDGRRFYHADSPTARLDAFDCDPETGALSRRRTLLALPGGQLPDGLTVDAEGRVWLAVWGQSCVLCVTPEGRIDRRIDLPTPLVTSCAFGGADYRTLFITTASEDPGDPQAGALFALEPGAQGLPPARARLP